MKITEYKTVRDQEAKGLDEKVNAQIGNGFQPHGGPYVCELWVCQALVKIEQVSAAEKAP